MMKNSAVFALVLFLAAACAISPKRIKAEKFDETTRAYEQVMHWSEFEMANNFHKETPEAKELPDLTYLQQFRITSYNVKKVIVADDTDTVEQIVEIRYYRTDLLVEKSLIVNEIWKYDETTKKWMLESELPNFR